MADRTYVVEEVKADLIRRGLYQRWLQEGGRSCDVQPAVETLEAWGGRGHLGRRSHHRGMASTRRRGREPLRRRLTRFV